MIKHRPQICDQSKRRFSPISPGIVQIQQPTDLLNFDELLSQNTLWQPSDPSQMFRSSAFKSNVHKGYLEQQRLSKPKSFSNLSASVLFLTDRPMADRQLRLYSAGLPLYSGLLPKQQGSKTSLTHHKYATWSTCSFCVHESSLNFGPRLFGSASQKGSVSVRARGTGQAMPPFKAVDYLEPGTRPSTGGWKPSTRLIEAPRFEEIHVAAARSCNLLHLFFPASCSTLLFSYSSCPKWFPPPSLSLPLSLSPPLSLSRAFFLFNPITLVSLSSHLS